MPSWVQSNVPDEDGRYRLIPKEEYQRYDPDAPAIHGQMESFVSPIDGTLIDDRGKLRRHNAQHGVTNQADYSEQWLKNRRSSIEREGQRELKSSRLNDIAAAIAQHGER